MANNTNFFSEWRAANDGTWFTTRSPHPDVPCFISPVPLKTVSNCSSYLPMDADVAEVKYYLEQQVLRLKYNNPEHTPFMVVSVITSRMAYWRGNDVLRKDAYYLGGLLRSVINECFDDSQPPLVMNCDTTKYWYSDEIINMSGVGRQGSERFKAKQAARQSIISEGYRDDFKVASMEYRRDNFDVLPTIKILTNNVPYTKNTVAKHGDDFYIHRVENIGQRVQKAREVYPKLNQTEIADILGESKRTVREYWRSK